MARIHEQGFTVVELILAVVAFAFIAAGLAQIFLGIIGLQRQAAYMETATRAAQTEVESLRNNNYSQLTAGQTIDFSSQLPSFLPSPRSGNVTITEPTAGIKRVDVTVSYQENGRTRNVELSSLIGVIGISQ
jgi:type II secretory pathway pseudopilin PulG